MERNSPFEDEDEGPVNRDAVLRSYYGRSLDALQNLPGQNGCEESN
jgi:hypothetical protein